MRKMIHPITFIFIAMIFGCSLGNDSNVRVYNVQELMSEKDNAVVEEIQIQHSNGHTVTVKDPSSIKEIIELMKEIYVSYSSDSPGEVGYIYRVKFETGSYYLNTMYINDKQYKIVNGDTTKLDETVLALLKSR